MSAHLWSDAYRPETLDELSYHAELSDVLKKLASAGEFPHLLFYGSTGAGKKTRIMALLRELFGPGAQRVRASVKPYKVSASKTIDLAILSSSYHVEMNPADAGIYDRVIVQEVLKSMASVHTMNTKSKRKFKVVLLEEVDHLTKDAQHALRRTMEKYMTNCRLILCCESVSRVIDPLRSRCLSIRVPAPRKPEIVEALQLVAEKESFHLPPELAEKIADASRRNLRRALLFLQMCHVETSGTLTATTEPKIYPWEQFIINMCNHMLEDQRPQVLNTCRQKVYELTVNCVPPTIVLRRMGDRLISNVDDGLKHEVAYWLAYHEQQMQKSSKKVVHITAFMARFMSVYKKWCDAWF